MKKTRKLSALLLALVMVFSLSVSAFAAENATVTLKITVNGQAVETYSVSVEPGDSVYDVVSSQLGTRATWTESPADSDYSPLPDGSNIHILTTLDGYGSVPYESTDLEPYDFYDSSTSNDDALDAANIELLTKYPESNGLGMWMGEGTGFSNDGPYMVYIGYDWMYTLNGATPGYEIDKPEWDNIYQYYMDEAPVAAGDTIELIYGLQITAFSY